MSYLTGTDDNEDQFDRHEREVAERRRRAAVARLDRQPTMLEELEITFTRAPIFGDERSRLRHELAEEDLTERQVAQHVVKIGCSVAFPDGTRLGPCEPLTLERL